MCIHVVSNSRLGKPNFEANNFSLELTDNKF